MSILMYYSVTRIPKKLRGIICPIHNEASICQEYDQPIQKRPNPAKAVADQSSLLRQSLVKLLE